MQKWKGLGMSVKKEKALKSVKNAILLLVGNFMLAFLVEAFVVPHDIIMGGATGLGIVLSKIIPLDTASIVFIINILMLILGGVVLGKKLVVTTVTSSVIYPVFLSFFQRIPNLGDITDNTLLATLLAGGFLGIALGLIMGMGASSGGIDVLDLVVSKWTHIPLAVVVYAIDFVIMASQLFVSDVESILYGLILLVLESVVMDRVLISGSSQLQVTAISDRYEVIRERLLSELDVGVTMLLIETGRMKEQQKGVMCVIPKRKLYGVTELIESVDPTAFVTVTQIKEVLGRGFTRERNPIKKEEQA